MLDDLRGLVVFAQVVEAQSFSKAAHRLGITKSAVSKHVQALEQQLGVQLLVRTTRKLSLTEVGERVYEASASIRDSAELAREAVSSHTGQVTGSLRITAPAVLGRKYVVPLVTAFLAQHPALQVELLLTDSFVDLLAERMDVALRVGRVLDASLVARKLATVSLVLAASPAYIARHGMPKHPEALAQAEWIHHTPRIEVNRVQLRKGRKQVRIQVRGRLACNDGAAGVQAAVNGSGVVLAPEFELSDEVRAGQLVPLLPDWSLEDLILSAVFPPRRHVSAKVRAFTDFVADRWREPPWRLVAP